MNPSDLEYVEYVTLDEQLQVVGLGFCQRGCLHEKSAGGQQTLEVPSGTLVPDYELGDYPLDLGPLKHEYRLKIRTAREQHILGGIKVEGLGTFDADPVSQSKLANAAVAGMLAQQMGLPFGVSWILKDNHVVDLSFEQLAMVVLTGAGFLNQAYAKSTELNEAVDKATTIGEIMNVDISYGDEE